VNALDLVESQYVGIVHSVADVLAAPDDARLFQRIAVLSGSTPLMAEGLSTPAGGGYSADSERARLAALGEAVERYSATAYVPAEELVLASADELGGVAVAPERFALFAPEQHARPNFPFVPFARDTRIRWVAGCRFADASPAYLPAQLVYLPRVSADDGEGVIGYATSNGLACGATFEEALLAGLLELFERDAFMITWAARLVLPRLDWSASDELRRFERAHLAPTRLRFETVDLSCFHDVPTVLAVVHADGRARGELGVGAAAAPCVEQAWKKAVAEAFAVRSAARSLVAEEPARRFAADWHDVETFEDHIRLYCDAEQARAAAFLDSSREARPVAAVAPLQGESTAQHLAAVVSRLERAGLDLFAVDVTPPDVREAGLHVVRAVVPELSPLDVHHGARFLGGARLRTVPFALGLARQPLTYACLNPDPHPFP
jgi:ribosomal protein S12 methylthiotransferase accessory factor